MWNCQLEHRSPPAITTNSLMLVIKSTTVDQSTSPNSPNSFGKVNKTFACVVLEFLSVSLLFDCWFDHSSQTSSPAPFTKNVSDDIYRDLTRSRNVIVNYCLCHEIGYYGMYNLQLIYLYISNLLTFNLYNYSICIHLICVLSICIFYQFVCI
jgi:hypothetical protein